MRLIIRLCTLLVLVAPTIGLHAGVTDPFGLENASWSGQVGGSHRCFVAVRNASASSVVVKSTSPVVNSNFFQPAGDPHEFVLTPPLGFEESFGSQLAMLEDRLAVRCRDYEGNTVVAVYGRNTDLSWSQSGLIERPFQAGADFGVTMQFVRVSNTRWCLIAAEPNQSTGTGGPSLGAVHLFFSDSTSPTVWSHKYKLVPSAYQVDNMHFGESLSVTERDGWLQILVGAPDLSAGGKAQSGAAFYYDLQLPQSLPTSMVTVYESTVIRPTWVSAYDRFGASVLLPAHNGVVYGLPDRLFVGAPGRNGTAGVDIGAVGIFSLVYDSSGVTTNYVSFLPRPTALAGEAFGTYLARDSAAAATNGPTTYRFIVGAPGARVGGLNNAGRVVVSSFQTPHSVVATITSNVAVANQRFGTKLSMTGGVGVPLDFFSGLDSSVLASRWEAGAPTIKVMLNP
jgi:hypothetical protein